MCIRLQEDHIRTLKILLAMREVDYANINITQHALNTYARG